MQRLTRRELIAGSLAASTLALISPVSSARGATVGGSADPFWFVHPELRPAAKQLQAMVQTFPPFSIETLPQVRQVNAKFERPLLADVPCIQRVIPGPSGAPDVTVYVINARSGTRRGGILHTHGGGFIAGSAATSRRDLQEIAAALDCGIVSVEYRLAPETRYSGSIDDNYAGLRWLHDHADEVGVDPSRLAVMGESAGGGHAALLAITARDRGEFPLAFQLLVQPMLDDRTGSTRQVPTPIGTVGWNAEANRFGWRSFLGQDPGTTSVPANAVPARVADVSGLPPAFIGVGSIDLFVEEDVAYAGRLIGAGIQTELLVVPGAFHGFDVIATDTSLAKEFTAAKVSALGRALRI